jgi:CheY-like chemotaxis protein
MFVAHHGTSLPTRPPLILVADDDEAMRTLLGTSLRSRNFEVRECRDGRELLHLLESDAKGTRTPSLIVSDLRMPGVTGLDVLHRLDRSLPRVPVILITAFGDPQTHRRAKALGAAAIIDKPFDLEEFHRQVTRALHADLSNGLSRQ